MPRLVSLTGGRRIAAAAVIASLLYLSGCGGGKGSVSGKVAYQGQPLPFGSVQFITSGGAFVSEIRSDGSYAISNVPTGEVKISVNCQDPKYADFMKQLSASARDPKIPKPKGKPEDFDRIPSQYNDPDKSGLSYSVKSGDQMYNIDLK